MDFVRAGTDARKDLDALEQKHASLLKEIESTARAPVSLDDVPAIVAALG